MEAKREFDTVTKLIKVELARFEAERVEDFKTALEQFLTGMIKKQQTVRGYTWGRVNKIDMQTYTSLTFPAHPSMGEVSRHPTEARSFKSDEDIRRRVRRRSRGGCRRYLSCGMLRNETIAIACPQTMNIINCWCIKVVIFVQLPSKYILSRQLFESKCRQDGDRE